MIRKGGRRVPRLLRRLATKAVAVAFDVRRGAEVLGRAAPTHPVSRVFYGHRQVPGLDERSHGGMVKFQHMQGAFPNAPMGFNVLYMVSSQPPRGAIGMARAARWRGAAVVWNQNGVGYPAWAGSDWQRVNEPMRAMFGLANHVFFQSEFCRTTAKLFVGEPRGTAEVLHNPVDTDFFAPSDQRPPEGLVLLLGGTQYQRYRLVSALEVLARVRRSRPDATLLVTGQLNWTADEAMTRVDADTVARRLGVEQSVTYSGPYTQRQAPGIFHRAHILLHTKYNDPCPGLVLEAMACGLPVVYSRSGGVPELVGEDAGIGIETEISWERDMPPDPQAMADAVLRVAADRDRYARAARSRAIERFDLALWVDRHRVVFEGLR